MEGGRPDRLHKWNFTFFCVGHGTCGFVRHTQTKGYFFE